MTASEAPTTEPTATEVTAAEMAASTKVPSATEMAASTKVPSATEMAAEGECVGRREHADRSRDGGGSQHGLEGLADHHALQCIAERFIRSDIGRLGDLFAPFRDSPHKHKSSLKLGSNLAHSSS
jgi:hypothetical protein